MKVRFSGPIDSMSGTSGDQVFVHLPNGTTYVRQRPYQHCPVPPPTAEQAQHRAFTSAASANWQRLSDRQRKGWEEFAKRSQRNSRGIVTTPTPIGAYVKSGVTCQILGLPLPTDPPRETQPSPVANIESVDVADPHTVRLRIRHSHPSTDGLAILVRMAPPPKTEGRKFYDAQYRYICGLGPQSTAPLPPDGGEVEFSATRFAVPPGQRFSIEVRVVRVRDGIASAPRVRDFRKPA